MYPDFRGLGREEILKILAVVILSDGTLLNSYKKAIKLLTSNKSECQHDFFKFLCLKTFDKEPKKCYVKFVSGKTGRAERYIQSTLSSKEVVKDLLCLNQNYKTTKGKLSEKDFLALQQPSLNFLSDESEKLKWLALRTWFDFDGCIMPSFKLKRKVEKKKDNQYIYYQVQFECEIRIAETNPSLVKDLLKLCRDLGLRAIKKKKSNWSGIDGICFSRFDDIRKFVFHGPVTEVPVSRKSPRFYGISKRKICHAVKSILADDLIKKSKYFKNKSGAVKYKKQMDRILFDSIKKVNDL